MDLSRIEYQASTIYFPFFARETSLMNKGEAIKVIVSIHLDLIKAFDMGLHSDIHITKAEKYELDKITIKRLLRWLRQCAQRAVIQSSLSDSESATSETLQLSLLVFFGSILLLTTQITE